MRRLGIAALLGLALAGFPATASAHVQVTPTVAAPADPTLFTLLVPNESDNPTVQIDLKIPDGVVAFSFEETPGWTRSETLKSNGALDVVTWKGSLPAGGFVRFSLLARTPETPGTIAWPAVQRYSDGTAVRWIGPPGSEEPAAVTTISADAQRQNAGGEAEGGDGSDGVTTSPTEETTTSEAYEPGPSGEASQQEPESSTAESRHRDGLTLGLAIVALAVAGAALGVAIARRRRQQ